MMTLAVDRGSDLIDHSWPGAKAGIGAKVGCFSPRQVVANKAKLMANEALVPQY
jgi:hypothetical protein